MFDNSAIAESATSASSAIFQAGGTLEGQVFKYTPPTTKSISGVGAGNPIQDTLHSWNKNVMPLSMGMENLNRLTENDVFKEGKLTSSLNVGDTSQESWGHGSGQSR